MKRWLWFPSLSQSIWLAFFLALCLSNWRLVLISADGDPCLHRRIGDWMIEHRTVIHSEQFSHTRYGFPLVSKEWLSEVLWAAAAEALDWNGMVLVAAILIATSLWALHRQLLSEGGDLLLATGGVLLAAAAVSHHWLARPHLVTHLFTVIAWWKLRAFDRGRLAAPRLFAWLVPLMLLWANLHGAFFTGFVLIAVCALGTSARFCLAARPARPALLRGLKVLVALGIVCLLATLVNPNGWKLHVQILQFLHSPVLAGYVNEFRSPDFHAGGMRGFLLVLLLLGVVLVALRPRLSPTDALATAVWGYLALRSVRNVPVFALVVIPVLAEHVNAWWRLAPHRGLRSAWQRISGDLAVRQAGAGGAGWLALAVAAMVLAMDKPAVFGGAPLLETELLTNRFPVAAVEFLKPRPAAIRGEMFNAYGWGGYLMWTWPERQVFVDGRNDFYGEEFMREFDRVDEVQPGWEAVLDRYRVGWTILPRQHPLCTILALRQARRHDWSLVYTDDVATVYTNVSP